MSSAIDPHIFRAYDIRGKAYTQLSLEAAELIGRGFGTVLQKKYGREPKVVVGRDARLSSPEMERAIVAGLLSTGCVLRLIDETPSPVNYFTICRNNFDGGMQITASHNPKDDNGIKLCTREAEPFSGNDIQTLRQMIEKSEFIKGNGSYEEFDGITPYVSHLSKLFEDVGTGLSVVIDTGNGVAGPVYADVLKRIGCEVVELFTEPDGTFPNHLADPSKHATLKDLQDNVKSWNANVGFGFDGDGDRLGVVDEKGNIVTADQTLLLLAQDHLSRNKGAPIVFTVSNSSLLETEVKKWGGKPVMCKVGHSFVEHEMRRVDSLLGGEQSGHFFLGEDYYPYDDALVAALRVLWILKEKGKAMSKLVAEFPKTYQIPESRPACPDDKKIGVIQRATEHFQKKYPVNTLDGARIDFGEGDWAGIRFSNTSPCLSICVEARNKGKLEAVTSEVLSHLRTYPEVDFSKK